MVEHRYRGRLMCHQCGATKPIPTECPKCGRDDCLSVSGPGVERLAEEAAERFDGARIALLSSDMAPGSSVKEAVASIARGDADIIIGTQIVAKGHNFPLLTLVGVIDADLGLQGGDLRAAERSFQLIRQVAGRAGRADKPGVAMIQTAAPDHPVMTSLLSGDEEAFLRQLAEERRAAGAPPYGRMAGIIVSGKNEEAVWAAAKKLGRGYKRADAHRGGGVWTRPCADCSCSRQGPRPAAGQGAEGCPAAGCVEALARGGEGAIIGAGGD